MSKRNKINPKHDCPVLGKNCILPKAFNSSQPDKWFFMCPFCSQRKELGYFKKENNEKKEKDFEENNNEEIGREFERLWDENINENGSDFIWQWIKKQINEAYKSGVADGKAIQHINQSNNGTEYTLEEIKQMLLEPSFDLEAYESKNLYEYIRKDGISDFLYLLKQAIDHHNELEKFENRRGI